MSQDQRTLRGYLLLADISGYTAFLVGTELEHANALLGKDEGDQPSSFIARTTSIFGAKRAMFTFVRGTRSRHHSVFDQRGVFYDASDGRRRGPM